jgi:hypothetical protein
MGFPETGTSPVVYFDAQKTFGGESSADSGPEPVYRAFSPLAFEFQKNASSGFPAKEPEGPAPADDVIPGMALILDEAYVVLIDRHELAAALPAFYAMEFA